MAALLDAQGLAAQGVSSDQTPIAALSPGQSAWDAVLTDQAMGDGDGWSVLRFLRARHPVWQVVLMSAGVGLDAFLAKSVLEAALVAKRADCAAPRRRTRRHGGHAGPAR